MKEKFILLHRGNESEVFVAVDKIAFFEAYGEDAGTLISFNFSRESYVVSFVVTESIEQVKELLGLIPLESKIGVA